MADPTAAKGTLDRLASFRVIYAGLLAYLLLSIAALRVSDGLLEDHFREAVDAATRVSPADGPIVTQIQGRVDDLVKRSFWTRWAGVRLQVIVLAADGGTPIYLEGRTLASPTGGRPGSALVEAERLLPAISSVDVDIPLDSPFAAVVFALLGTVLVPTLLLHQRYVAQREAALIRSAVTARQVSVERAQSIQRELEKVREQLARVEPAERAQAAEIRSLEAEREALRAKLAALEERTTQLRHAANRSVGLEQEHRALEDLLEEALQDMGQKEQEIQELQERLKKASKAAPPTGRRSVEQLTRRLRTLYRNLEIDDRALHDIVGLGDELMKLRAEEGLKRLDASPDDAGIRRKVGGLPPKLSIFEMGFAGKGRIYYTRGRQRPFRILAVGAKNSQKTDLEYLSRLDSET